MLQSQLTRSSDLPEGDPHPIRRRFWRFGLALLLAVLMVVAGVLYHSEREGTTRLSFGHDLIPSYAAGMLVREGRPKAMYDRVAVETIERETIERANLHFDWRYAPWLNPPFYAWVFAPLSAFPYREALLVFTCFNLVLYFASLALLRNILRDSSIINHQSSIPPHAWALVPLLLSLANPAIQAFGHQQNTFISLLLLCGTVTFWRAGAPFRAGLVAGLLFFKPQLAVVVSAALILMTGWRALAGVAITGLSLLLLTLITMPGCLTECIHRLPVTIHWLQQEAPYNWGRQVTLWSFWRMLFQGHVRGPTGLPANIMAWLTSAALLLGLGWGLLRYLRSRADVVLRDRLIAAAIVTMPLVMPYYMDYDLTLLAVAAVLLAAEWINRPDAMGRTERRLLAAWVAFYFITYLSPGVGGKTRFNLTAPAMFVVAALSIVRCLPIRWESAAKAGTPSTRDATADDERSQRALQPAA